MRRLLLVAALLVAAWPLAPCPATTSAVEPLVSCHEGAAPKPAQPPVSDCGAMSCCEDSLLPGRVESARERFAPALAIDAASPILVSPSFPAQPAPAAPPGPPGVLLAASRLGRAPPAA